MELYQGAFIIIAVFGILMLILAVKTNSVIILNFLLRSIAGALVAAEAVFLREYLSGLVGFNRKGTTLVDSSVDLDPGT